MEGSSIINHLKHNLLVQFSVISFVVMAAIGVLISTMLGNRLDHNVEHLQEHNVAMMAGVMVESSDHISMESIAGDVRRLRWVTYGAISGGFLILYLSLVLVVGRGWWLIRRQQSSLRETNEKLEGSNAELHEARARSSMILESAGDGIFGMDLQGGISFANASAAKMLQWSPDELIGQPYSKFMDGGGSPSNGTKPSAETSLIDGVLQGRGTNDSPHKVFLRKDGSVFSAEVLASPMESENGEVIGVVCTFKDVTERLLGELKLKRSSEDLARSNAELEQFAYVASHDLQEPLRMVTSYCQLLDRRYKDKLDDDGREFIRYAVDGATRMQTLINDLLTYSRVGSEARPVEPVDFNQVLSQVLDNLKASIDETGATVTHGDLPVVDGDGPQMVQLLQNLISNSIKYQGEHSPQIHVDAERIDGEWQFSIQDNGIGIEPQYSDRIFGIFERLHVRDEYPGTGIGLAVCKKIVEGRHGRVWFKSKLGAGATFYCTVVDRQATHHIAKEVSINVE